MEYADALDHLESLINHETTPRAGRIEGLGLDPIRALTDALGQPQTAYPVIHITGTNGKGSTARIAERLLETMGLRVGTYASPHLESPTERIRVGGASVDDDDFGALIGDVVRAVDAHGFDQPTWFETLTAAALHHFANEAVDVAVVEVGMLGRFDATNVVEASVAVVTNVGLDHTDGAGDWRRAIAEEKAGIVTPGRPLVLGEPDPGLREVFTAEGAEPVRIRDTDFGVTSDQLAVGGRLLDLRTPRGVYDEVFLHIHGAHQGDNAVVALVAVEEFFDAALPDDVVSEALDKVSVPGRLEIVGRSPLVVLDAAHNVPGAEAFTASFRSDFGESGRRYMVLGLQDGRDAVAVCRALAVADVDVVVTTRVPTARGLPAAEVAAAVTAAGGVAETAADVAEALERLDALAGDDDLVAVVGSAVLVGEARSLLVVDDDLQTDSTNGEN